MEPADNVSSVRNKIRSSLAKSAFDSRDFLPLDRLCEILSPSVVRQLLLEHFKEPKVSEYERGILGTQDGDPPRRRRIFAILVMARRVNSLAKFIEHGIDDTALPLHFGRIQGPRRGTRVSYTLHQQDDIIRQKTHPHQNDDRQDDHITKEFDVWPVNMAQDFMLWQPIIYVPFFKFPGDKIYFYELRQDSILPFSNYEPQGTGGYGCVRKATIHHSHHNRERNSKYPQSDCFAIKKPHIPLYDYLQEIESFDKLSADNDKPELKHLIPLQLAFRHGRDYYLVFPWADGNLKKFWSQQKAHPENPDEVCWFMDQCSGIARGLRRLHHLSTELSQNVVGMKTVNAINGKEMILGGKEWGRHGDIKPENILWFKNYNDEKDVLVISDFGLTQSAHSRPKVHQDQILEFSGTYRPPDLHLEGQDSSQNYDVWSLGCVFLEFLSWFLLGYEKAVVFSQERVDDSLQGDVKEDTFFTLEKVENHHHRTSKKATLKKSVVEWIKELHKIPECTEPLHSLLDLIQFAMLVPNPDDRWKSWSVDIKLRQLASRCKRDDFAMKPSSRGPDPNMYSKHPEICRISLPRSLVGPSNLDNEFSEPDVLHLKRYRADNASPRNSHDPPWDNNQFPLQPAAMPDLSHLTLFNIELVADRGNAFHMDWEVLHLNASNLDDIPGMKQAAGPKSNAIQYEQPASQASFDSPEHAASTRFSNDWEKMKHVGLSDMGSITDPARDELWTDSGYASWGKATAPTSVGNSTLKQQPDESESTRLSDHDDDDTATVYSVAASVPEEDMETYKSEISQAIINAVRPHVSDVEQLEALKSPLPALLQSFALRLGCSGSSKAEKEIMYFVHKHRNDIASRLNDAIRNTEDEEDQTTSAAAQNKAPGRWNIAQWARGVGEGEVTEQDLPHPRDIRPEENSCWYPDLTDPELSEEEDELLEEEDELLEEEEELSGGKEEQPSLLDQRGYRDAVFNSVAYKWLTAALVKTLTMDPVGGEDMTFNVSKEINDILGRKRTVSSRSPSERHVMAFVMEWNPTLFLREQFPDATDTGRLLRQVLTLTGSAIDAQVLPCADYLRQTWPATGSTILELLEDALVTGNEVSRELEDRSLVTFLFDHSLFHAKVEGTADSIITVAEQITWVGASLRQSCSDSGLATCRPRIQTSRPTITGAPTSCHVEFSVEEHKRNSQESSDGQCWHEIFQNPVVVEGYPIPRRAQYGSGLEIPLNVMAGLTGCPRIHQYMGHHFLKGFSTALVPTGKTKDAVLWHLYYSEDGSRLPYPDMEPMDKVNIGLHELTQVRHIVGWCSKAEFYAGAAGMNYDIKPSRLEQPGREFALEKVSFSAGQFLTGGVQFAIGRKDIPVRISHDSYWKKLNWLDQKYVTLWDVDEKRGWLVNGNAALLHLLRASLEFSKKGKFNAEFLFQEDKFEESTSPFTLNSVREVLVNRTNQELQLCLRDERSTTETKLFPNGETEVITKTITSWTTIKDRVEELHETLEKLIDHNAMSEASYKGLNAKPRLRDVLQGWDFSDIASDRDPFYLKNAKLPLDLMSWVEFTRSIHAITLFGKGFGDIIRASPPDPSCCQIWRTVPKNRHLLCVSVADLRVIMGDDGNQGTGSIEVAPEVWWKNPFNNSPFRTDCLCATKCEAMEEEYHHCIQKLVSTKAHAVSSMTHSASNKLGIPSPESVVDIHLTEHDSGAVIFGAGVFGRRAGWKFSRDTSTTPESLDPESSQVRALGHSSTSSESNVVNPSSLSSPTTLGTSGIEGRNSPATPSAVSTEIQALTPTATVREPDSGSQTPDSHQAARLEHNDPPSQVVESTSPENSGPKKMSLRRKVTELFAKKWRERKSEDT